MLRSGVMVVAILLSCAGALPAKAQAERAPIGSSMSAPRELQQPALDRAHEALSEQPETFNRHRHDHGFLGFPYYYYGTTYAEPPPVNADEGVGVPLPLPAPAQAADLPPCREDSGGVVVIRGTGCRP